MKRAYFILGSIAIVLWFLYIVSPILSRSRTEALVQKAQGEMRSLATVVFDYQASSASDLKKDVFPVGVETTSVESATPAGILKPFRFGTVDEMWPFLKGPIQVVESIPSDPFSHEGEPYFVADWGPIFLILCVGPNGKLDVTPKELETAMYDPAQRSLAERVLIEWSYSPTNGSASSGDLIRLVQ